MSIADLLIAIKELQLNKIYAPAVLTKKYLEESVFAQARCCRETQLVGGAVFDA